MKKERAAVFVTVAFMAGLAAIIVVRQIGFRNLPESDVTPQTAIYNMLDAARAGNVGEYLDQYSGQLKASMKQVIAEKTEPEFARYLRNSDAEIKGVAVSDPKPLSDREVSVRIEYVYQDRNEAQTIILEKSGNRWNITRVESAERVKTLVPYGTLVE